METLESNQSISQYQSKTLSLQHQKIRNFKVCFLKNNSNSSLIHQNYNEKHKDKLDSSRLKQDLRMPDNRNLLRNSSTLHFNSILPHGIIHLLLLLSFSLQGYLRKQSETTNLAKTQCIRTYMKIDD